MNESKAATSGDRRIYVWWGAGFAFLALLAVFGWYFLRPYLEVRAAARRIIAKTSSAEDEVKALGGPEKAATKCSLYVRCPERLATEKGDAFKILAACGRPAFPWAESLLHSRDENVRERAAWVLGKLKDRRAVEPLIAALKDSSAEVRCSAAWALGKLKDPRAAGPLIEALKDSSARGRVRGTAAGALSELKDPRTVELLIAALKDANYGVRCSAAYALGELQDPRAVEPLKALLADPDIRPVAEANIQKIEAARP